MEKNFDLTGYLKAVTDLECSIYRQEKVISEAKKQLKSPVIKRKHAVVPIQGKTVELPKKPEKPVDNRAYHRQWAFDEIKGAIIVSAFFILVFPLIIYFFYRNDHFLFPLLITVICAGIGIRLLMSAISKYSETLENLNQSYVKQLSEYERDSNTYEERLAKAKEENLNTSNKYKAEYEQYLKDEEKYTENYEKAVSNAKNNLQSASDSVNSLTVVLDDTKAALKELYDLDIVFAKYRNMFAMSTMYEYFASGRCKELEGPDGAYNLYETEVRQNLIINRLDRIISELQQIKANQYILYSELEKTNKEIDTTNSYLTQIVNNTKSIADTSALNAYLSSITAANTAVIASAAQYIAIK